MDLQQRLRAVQRPGSGSARQRQRDAGRLRRRLPRRRQGAQRGRGGVRSAPALAARQPQQPRPQHAVARVVRRGRRGGGQHVGQAARLGRQDQRAAADVGQPGINRPPPTGQQVHPGPQRVHHRTHQPRIPVRQAGQRKGDLRHRLARHRQDPGGQLPRVIGRSLAPIGQGQQGGHALPVLLAGQQPRVVGPQRRRQHRRHPVQHRLVHRLPGPPGGHQEAVGLRRQPNRPAPPRPERHQPVIVRCLPDRLHGRRHVLGQPIPQPGGIQQRRERQQRHLRRRQRHPLLRPAIRRLQQQPEAAHQPHDGRVGRGGQGAEVGRRAHRVRDGRHLQAASWADRQQVAPPLHRAVGTDRQVDLHAVADAVRRALQQEAHPGGHGPRRRVRHRHGVIDARRPAVGPGEPLLRGALHGQAVERDHRAPGPARPLDDPADQPGLEAVARPHEPRQRRLRHHRLPHPELPRPIAEPVGAADRLGPQHEHRQRVRQLHVHPRLAVRAEPHARLVQRDRGEVLADGDVLHAEVPRLVAAGGLVQRDDAERHAAGVAGGNPHRPVHQEGRQRVQRLLLGERQHGLVQHPDRRLPGHGTARPVNEVQHHVELLRRPGLRGGVEADGQPVLHGGHGQQRGRGERHRLALVERRPRLPGAGQASAHQQHMHGQPRRLRLADRHLQPADAVGHVEPLVAEPALRLLDHRQGAGGLERALQQQGRGLAGGVLGLVRGQGHRLGRRAGPGDGGVAGHEQVHPHHLAAARLVLRLQLDDVNPGVPHVEVQRQGGGAAGQAALLHRLVQHLGPVLGRPLREVAGLQGAVPVAAHQADAHGQIGQLLSLGVQGDHLRLDGASLRQVARHLHPEHEGRQGRDALGAADLEVVVAGDGGLDQVLPGLRRRLDGGVQRQGGAAGRVGPGLAVQHRGRAKGGVPRVAAVAGEQEALVRPVVSRGRPGQRELRHAPGDGAVGQQPAGEEPGQQVDGERLVQRRAGRAGQHGLEGRQAVGFFLHGDGAAGLGVLRHIGDAVVAGRLGLLAEADVEAANVVQGHRQAPLLVIRGGHDDLSGAGGIGERPAAPAPDHAGDQDRLLRSVDRALGEHVAQQAGRVAASGGRRGDPGQPRLAAGLPAVARIDLGAAARLQHKRVRALGHDEAPGLHTLTERRRQGPGAVSAGCAPGQGGEVRAAVAAILQPLDADLRALDRPGRRQGGDDKAHPVGVLHRRQHEVGDLHAHPAPVRTVGGAEADQVCPRLALAADTRQMRPQVQAELGRHPAAADRQVHQGGHRGGAQRRNPGSHVVARNRLRIGPGGGFPPRQRRGGVVLRHQRLARERPEVAGQRIDGMDAQVGAVVTLAAQGDHLRAEPLGDALGGVPRQRRPARREAEPGADCHGQAAPTLVVQRAGGNGQFVGRVGSEACGNPQLAPGGGHRQVIHGRGDAQGVAGLHDVGRGRVTGQLQGEGAGAGRRAVLRAADGAVPGFMGEASAAVGVRQGEGGGAADAGLEGRVVQAGLVGQAQADDGDLAVRHWAAQHQ